MDGATTEPCDHDRRRTSSNSNAARSAMPGTPDELPVAIAQPDECEPPGRNTGGPPAPMSTGPPLPRGAMPRPVTAIVASSPNVPPSLISIIDDLTPSAA